MKKYPGPPDPAYPASYYPDPPPGYPIPRLSGEAHTTELSGPLSLNAIPKTPQRIWFVRCADGLLYEAVTCDDGCRTLIAHQTEEKARELAEENDRFCARWWTGDRGSGKDAACCSGPHTVVCFEEGK